MRLVVGDITDLPVELGVDVIVNAANEALAGGAGVDGAIHHAAGPELLAHTEQHQPRGCPTGSAVATPAFGLEARGVKRILHTVGPVWSGQRDIGVPGAPGDDSAKLGYTYEDTMLASCYTRCLQLATQLQSHAIAFPAISTGVYGFPKPRAARIALGHVLGHFQQRPAPTHPINAVFVCFSEQDAAVYREAIETRDAWMFTSRRA
ncbi:MAG: macro domain-containing protein [Planctomycetota bacterium]